MIVRVEREVSGSGLESRADFYPSYTRSIISSYDGNRHIALDDARGLINNENLPALEFDMAVQRKQIHVYDFKGIKYVDRLDIGRIFHEVPETKSGVKLERYFSDGKTNPLDTVGPYEERALRLIDKKGNLIFDMPDAQFPKSWDSVSAQIVAQKYFFAPSKKEWKDKLFNKIGNVYENSIKHLFTRISNFFADEGAKLGYFASEEDKTIFRDELLYLQINRMMAFNSPVEFNAGIFNEYGITGTPGINYRTNPKTGEVVKIKEGDYIYPQCHACFIKGPRDDLESIANHFVDETAVFASGSGIGQNIGALRGENEKLSGGGKSSGSVSFLKIFDRGAGAIKSGGKSRRAARMTSMKYNHRDILEFIRAKVREDHKALTLMKAGYEAGMDGEAYTTVALQNTNLSVRCDDYFFEQVAKGGEIELRNVIDGKIVNKISADRMLKEIAFGSWRIGDPAVQYSSKINEMHTCKNSGEQQSTNPCAEYLFLDDTSCNLASLNLLRFTDNKGNFNVESYRKAAEITSIALDIANDASSYPIRDIAEISPEFRTIGLGYANAGALLMRRGVAYDSEEGRAFMGGLTAILTGVSYETSSKLAEKMGAFIHFEFNKSSMREVIKKHRSGLENIVWEHVPEDIKKEAYRAWDSVVEKSLTSSFRNAQATVIAPTGTISFLMGCDTTGIEPSLSLLIGKDLAGGGRVVLVNNEVQNALKNLGYNGKQIKEISDYVREEVKKDEGGNSIFRGTIRGAPHLNPQHYPIFDTSFGNHEGAGSIEFEGHVRMMGVVQPFVSGAISKTCNVPNKTTVKQIYNSFLFGYKLGLKGLTIFRDGSKPVSAVNFGGKGYLELKRGEKKDMPGRRDAYEVEVSVGGAPLHLVVSEYENGTPGQIVFLSYKAGSTLGALLSTSGIQASTALKRGVHLEDVIKGWIGQSFEPNGLVSGHPFIKMASSPLDFAAKFLRLEYLGDLDIAENKEGLTIEKLRGYKNGAIETYKRMGIDEWKFEDMINDAGFGGFAESDSRLPIVAVKDKPHITNGNGNGNAKGKTCNICGNLMNQTSSNCYECKSCGDKIGGCGA